MTASTSVLVLLLICPSAYFGKSISEQPNKAVRDTPQDLVDKWISQKPAGAVVAAIVSPEETEFFFGGKLSAGNPVPPNEHSIFEIGSITKPFTGLLLASKILSGNLSLSDTLEELLTDWPGRHSAPAANVRLSELATHSSGLARLPDNLLPAPIPDNPYVNYTTKELYEWLDKAPLLTRGSFVYSNVGAGILGHVLEVNAGLHFEELLKQRILIPLGLRDTTITLNSEQRTRLAPGHDHENEVSNWDFDVLAPAGALRSTASELVHFLRLATGIEDIPTHIGKALEFATMPRHTTTIDNAKIGLFWLRSMLPENKVLIWHNGGTGGYNSYLGWNSERQIGVVVLATAITDQETSVDVLASSLLRFKLGI